MSKKPKRRNVHDVSDALAESATVTSIGGGGGSTEPVVVERRFPEHPQTHLERIRNDALSAQSGVNAHNREIRHDVQRTINDLENWRAEIDATIAFLKAMPR